jgi:predicted DNA-binding transcriptional regulator AlpA
MKVAQYVEYRTFSKAQIDEFIKEDQLPKPLATEMQKRWANKMK